MRQSNRMRTAWAGLWGSCCWIAILAGCGDSKQLVPAVGTITVDGRPAVGAVLLFHPDDIALATASAVADADGNFSFMTDMESGIPAGKYRVTVTWPDPAHKPTPEQVMMGTAESGRDLLKGRYDTKAKSTIDVEITPDTTTLAPLAP